MSVVVETLRDYRVVDQFGSADHLAVVWRERVGDQEIEGLDTLRCDVQGRVREITVFVRPLPALAALTNALATRLARKRSRAGAFAVSMLVAPLAFLTRIGDGIVTPLARPRNVPSDLGLTHVSSSDINGRAIVLPGREREF